MAKLEQSQPLPHRSSGEPNYRRRKHGTKLRRNHRVNGRRAKRGENDAVTAASILCIGGQRKRQPG